MEAKFADRYIKATDKEHEKQYLLALYGEIYDHDIDLSAVSGLLTEETKHGLYQDFRTKLIEKI